MRATERLLIASHIDCSAHRPFPGHPDQAARLEAAVSAAALPDAEMLPVDIDEAEVIEAIERVHDASLAPRLRDACSQAPTTFDSPDNPVSSGSYASAIAAVAATLAGAGAAAEGRASTVWVPVRPPGHHATRAKAMGFCFFNNVAIAAEALVNRGVRHVAVVDFDVHHGNGTAAHFDRRFDVFYLSVHRYPFFPGSGAGSDVGSGPGYGYTRNFPLAVGADDEIYVDAVREGIAEILARIDPEIWLVSAGFDAHRDDPLGGMKVTEDGFFWLGRAIRKAASERPVVAVLEGGYHLASLRESVRAFLEGVTENVNS